MIKLIIQLVVAGIIGFGAAILNLHWLLAALSVIAGMVAVHLIWEKFVFSPFDYLGVMPVRTDDPIMLLAQQRALDTIDEFINELYPENQADSMVRIKYENASGENENIWCDLVDASGAQLSVYVRTFPLEPRDDFDSDMNVPIEAVIDWSVELRDGTLRGGFSNQAMFKIFQRQEGYMHPKFIVHMNRFRDPLTEPDPAT